MEELKKRKTTRLKGADYNGIGAFFLTICTDKRRCILSRVVGTDVLGGPQTECTTQTDISVELLPCGRVAEKYIKQLNDFYDGISIDGYVIMPNHIHILLQIKGNGPSGTPVPTNTVIAKFVSTFKRFCNKEYGTNIWQYRSHDHIIRDREDYENYLRYICENPMCWRWDELYSEE